MATSIVDSLFGPKPWEVNRAENASLGQSADKYAAQDPFQRATGQLYRAGGMLARPAMEEAGYVNPAVQEAQRSQAVMGMGGDLSTPVGLKAKAAQFLQAGDQQTALKLILLSRQMEAEDSKRKLEEAHAKYYEMGGANKGKYSPENIAALSDKERASKLMVARNTANLMSKDMNFPSEEARVAWVDGMVEKADNDYLRANPLAGKSALNPQVVPSVPPQTSAPQVISRPDGFPVVSKEEQAKRNSERIAIIKSELEKDPTNPSLLSELAQATQAQMSGSPFSEYKPKFAVPTMVQSVEAKARAKATGENDPAILKPAAIAKESGKVEGEASGKANVALSGFDDTKKLVEKQLDELLKHPGFESTVGATWKPGLRFIPGTQEASFMKRLDQIKGGSFLKAYETLKGGGQITEIEGQKATDAINRMDISTNEKEFRAAAKDFLDAITVGFNKLKSQSKLGNVKPPEPNSGSGSIEKWERVNGEMVRVK